MVHQVVDRFLRRRMRSLYLARFHFPRIETNSPASLNILDWPVSRFLTCPIIHNLAARGQKSLHGSSDSRFNVTDSPLRFLFARLMCG